MADLISREDVTCRSCKWHDDFSGVCCNGDSEHRADFTRNDDSCGCWDSSQVTKGDVNSD